MAPTAELDELVARGGLDTARIVVRVECPVCEGSGRREAIEGEIEPSPVEVARGALDCGRCEGAKVIEVEVPIMDFVSFVLEHTPAREPADFSLSNGQHRASLQRMLSEALDRARSRRATEVERQEALSTAGAAAAALREMGE